MLALVHVASLAPNEGLIHFNCPTQLIEGPVLHRKADSMQHEPSGLLGDTETTMDFITADAVFAGDDNPRGREPLFERDRRVLKNGPGLEREAGHRVASIAFPHALLCQPRNAIRTTLRAFHHALRPAQLDHELAAMLEVGEVENCISEGGFAVHNSILRQKLGMSSILFPYFKVPPPRAHERPLNIGLIQFSSYSQVCQT